MIYNFLKKNRIRKQTKIQLHIGCGDNYFDGWINLDINSRKANIRHNMNKPLWLFDNTVAFIYSEHFIEHISVKSVKTIFKEFYRVLKPGGVCRIATPDLDYIVAKFNSDSWYEQDWINENECYHQLETPAEMLNTCFYTWGHKYLYNEEELKRRFSDAGFVTITRKAINESQYAELKNLETRSDSKLIIEAIK